MPTPVILVAARARSMDPDVLAAWVGTDRPTVQALLSAGLPVPLEEADSPAAAEALVTRYQDSEVAAEAVLPAALPGEWIKATIILALSAALFKGLASADPLFDLSILPLMGALYTAGIGLVMWLLQRRRATLLTAQLDTARRHLDTASPRGPSTRLITRIRGLRREVVAAGLPVVPQGDLLRQLFDLEIALNTTETLPIEAAEAVEDVEERLARMLSVAGAKPDAARLT